MGDISEDSSKSPRADWEAIEGDYRAGVKTLRSMAEEHGLTEGAIRKRATRDGWERDLSQRVAQRAQELVRKAEVRSGDSGTQERTARQAIEILATNQKEIILRQRAVIVRHRALEEYVLTQLEADTKKPEADRLGLAAFNKIRKEAVETTAVLNAIERSAFGIDKNFGEGPSDTPKDVDPMDTARRVAFLLTKAVKEK